MRVKNLKRMHLFLLLSFSISIAAQQTNYTVSDNKSKISVAVDTKKLKRSNERNAKVAQPFLEAKLYKLGIEMDTVGVWETNDVHQKVWKLSFDVPGANGFILSFDDFYLPEQGKLYVYNKDNSKDAIVYLHEDNPKGGAYSIEDLLGDNVILEYVAPETEKEKPKFLFAKLGCKYLDNQNQNQSGYDTQSNFCMININCEQGADWQIQKKGILRLRMTNKNDESSLCSGTLINNTDNDKTPYVLTAQHCFLDMDDSEISNTEFFFDYESPDCTTKRPVYRYHKGAESLVINPLYGGSDGALVKINEPLPQYWDVYFNGWDRGNDGNKITSGSIIHHPQGDIKKITLFNTRLISDYFNDNALLRDTHWRANYSLGVTDRGSSGAPIFSNDGLVVGTLTGGGSDCYSLAFPDYYGKFWYHFDQMANPAQQMKAYLDPANTNQIKLGGISNIEGTPDLILDELEVNMLLNYTSDIHIISGNGGYTVSSSNSKVVNASINGSKITISATGFGTATLTITDKVGKTREVTVTIHKDIEINRNSDQELIVKLYRPDDYLKQIRLYDLMGITEHISPALDKVTEHTINIGTLQKGVHVIIVETTKGVSRTMKIAW